MTNKEKNDLMAKEIVSMLIKHNICSGTGLYYNNRLIKCYAGQTEVIENVKIEDYLEWGNPDTVSLSYEGVDSLYLLVNGYAEAEVDKEKAKVVIDELTEIGKRYNRYFEIGNENILFYIENEERSEIKDTFASIGDDLEKYHLIKE